MLRTHKESESDAIVQFSVHLFGDSDDMLHCHAWKTQCWCHLLWSVGGFVEINVQQNLMLWSWQAILAAAVYDGSRGMIELLVRGSTTSVSLSTTVISKWYFLVSPRTRLRPTASGNLASHFLKVRCMRTSAVCRILLYVLFLQQSSPCQISMYTPKI